MFAQLLAQADFVSPTIDWHAFGPELVLVATIVAVVLLDTLMLERAKPLIGAVAGVGLLAAVVPVITIAVDGVDRAMFGGAFVVDDFALVMKAMFLLGAYIVVLLSTNYIGEGDYWEAEYYELLLASVLGMLLMSSARDLVSIFVALELLSIPAYMLAAWQKRELKGNEAGVKYYLMGVFASAIMLYGMSLLYGVSGSTLLVDISLSPEIAGFESTPIVTLAIVFVIIGFAFKVSAVPFHTWAPDTYEGAPTPITAFLAVSSKAAGFVALLQLVFVGFLGRSDVWEPLFWVLAAVTMTVGNLIALRQTNMIRLLAYSGIAQAGFILAPLAVAGTGDSAADAVQAIVVYLVIYTAMNLGAFAVIIAIARRTRSAELDSISGLFNYAPGLTVGLTIFLFSLAGIPPLAGWFAKFEVITALTSAGSTSGYVLAGVAAVNSVIGLYYYSRVAVHMWFTPVPVDADQSEIAVPVSLRAAVVLTAIVTIVLGVFPGLVADLGDAASSLALVS